MPQADTTKCQKAWTVINSKVRSLVRGMRADDANSDMLRGIPSDQRSIDQHFNQTVRRPQAPLNLIQAQPDSSRIHRRHEAQTCVQNVGH